jgi:hypothetical protein
MTDAQFDELWTFVKKRKILENKSWRDSLEEGGYRQRPIPGQG